MTLNLKEIRERLLALQGQQNNRQEDTAYYPFWNMQDGAVTEVRFLPDENPNNPFFWVERLMIRLPFEGTINGQTNTNNRIEVVVPCMEMYGKKCPIQEEIRPMWKDKSLEEVARTYYKKRSYIFQGFVVKDGLGEENPPENPIRKILINPSLFKIIRDILLDPDIEDLVIDFDKGRDFRIKKTRRGNYSDYSTSQFALKSRSLSEEERNAIQTYGLYDLSTLLPSEPTEKHLQAIIEMFQASIEGEPYDYDRWGQYYKPLGKMTSVNSQSDQEEDTTQKLYSSAKLVSTVTNKPRIDVVKKVSLLNQENNDNENSDLSDRNSSQKLSEKLSSLKTLTKRNKEKLEENLEENIKEADSVEETENTDQDTEVVETFSQKVQKRALNVKSLKEDEKNVEKMRDEDEEEKDNYEENSEKVKNILNMLRKMRNN